MTGWSWYYLGDDVTQMTRYPFMVNALLAGAAVAVVAGALGWFLVLRREAFAAHTLSVVGFPGAAAATYAAVDPGLGFYGGAVLAALLVAGAGRRAGAATDRRERDAVIAMVQAAALATGLLFVSLAKGFLTGLTNLLFGSVTGISDGQLHLLLGACAGVLVLLALLARPLLFASVDPAVAAARGVPVGRVGTAFLLLLALGAAGAAQVVGALLVFALLVAPAAAASRLTARPGRAVALSVLLALVETWVGETAAFYTDAPIGFWVTAVAFAAYLLAVAVDVLRARRGRRPARKAAVPA